jgi:hypothetical protein
LAQRRWSGVGTPARAIVTLAGLAGAALERLDVLVRADGGQHVPPALDGIAIRASAHNRRPLLVVDVDDRYPPRLRQWARQRRAAYLERGWVVDSISPATTVERFLASRPGGAR